MGALITRLRGVAIGLYAKAIGNALLTAAAAWISALQDQETPGLVTALERIAIISALVLGLGAVAAIPNSPEWIRRYVPAIVAGVIAVLSQLGVLLPGGLDQAEILLLLIAVLGSMGLTAAVPNAAASDPPGGTVPAVQVVAMTQPLPEISDRAHAELTDGPVAGPGSPLPTGTPVDVVRAA